MDKVPPFWKGEEMLCMDKHKHILSKIQGEVKWIQGKFYTVNPSLTTVSFLFHREENALFSRDELRTQISIDQLGDLCKSKLS